MPITKAKKEELIKDVAGRVKNSEVVVFYNFHGVNVENISKLRGKLREINGSYKVTRKTLISKALEDFNVEGNIPVFEGELGLIFGEDAVSAPKILSEFIKENGEKNDKILGGILENRYIDGKSVIQLSKIPPREILLSQLVYGFSAPMQQMVGVLQGTVRNFVCVLDQIKNNK